MPIEIRKGGLESITQAKTSERNERGNIERLTDELAKNFFDKYISNNIVQLTTHSTENLRAIDNGHYSKKEVGSALWRFLIALQHPDSPNFKSWQQKGILPKNDSTFAYDQKILASIKQGLDFKITEYTYTNHKLENENITSQHSSKQFVEALERSFENPSGSSLEVTILGRGSTLQNSILDNWNTDLEASKNGFNLVEISSDLQSVLKEIGKKPYFEKSYIVDSLITALENVLTYKPVKLIFGNKEISTDLYPNREDFHIEIGRITTILVNGSSLMPVYLASKTHADSLPNKEANKYANVTPSTPNWIRQSYLQYKQNQALPPQFTTEIQTLMRLKGLTDYTEFFNQYVIFRININELQQTLPVQKAIPNIQNLPGQYKTIEINEFRTGIQIIEDQDGQGFVSGGFLGVYSDNTFPNGFIPYEVEATNAGGYFQAVAGNTAAQIIRQIKGKPDYSVIVVLSRIQDDKGRTATMFRYHSVEGDNLYQLAPHVRTYDIREKRYMGQPSKVNVSLEKPVLTNPNLLKYLNSPLPIILPYNTNCTTQELILLAEMINPNDPPGIAYNVSSLKRLEGMIIKPDREIDEAHFNIALADLKKKNDVSLNKTTTVDFVPVLILTQKRPDGSQEDINELAQSIKQLNEDVKDPETLKVILREFKSKGLEDILKLSNPNEAHKFSSNLLSSFLAHLILAPNYRRNEILPFLLHSEKRGNILFSTVNYKINPDIKKYIQLWNQHSSNPVIQSNISRLLKDLRKLEK